MLRYALRRLLTALPVALIAVTACFFMLRLAPGGPFDDERPLPEQIRKNLERHYHLDKPLVEQYGLYLSRLARGDLGPSFTDYTYDVNEKIGKGLPYTLQLGGWALLLGALAGVLSGIFSALRPGRFAEHAVTAFILAGLVLPNFLVAPLLQEYLGKQVGFLKIGGWGDGGFANLALPVLVLSLPHAARVSRLMRGSLLEVMSANFVLVARAKGIGESAVVFRHAVRPALLPVVSYLGPAAGYLLTGSIVVENIFGLPGVGKFFIDAALSRDYGMVLGTVVFYMFLILTLNLAVDLLYALLDPRVRHR